MNIIRVFSETKRKRRFVGELLRTKQGFEFVYSDEWLNYDKAFDLGPDIPLSGKTYRFSNLPDSFKTRIPPKSSENYKRYCEERGISSQETDVMILLGTIAHKGPSSFVFELSDELEKNQIVKDRIHSLLKVVSLRDLATLFQIPVSSMSRFIHNDISKASSLYKLIEICLLSPEAFLIKISQAQALVDPVRSELKKWVRETRGVHKLE